ncbi:MAG: Palmitoyltransferase [Alyxoria varia]|nr:MAG: Palmitoyltransferase [Alyxoria varia]
MSYLSYFLYVRMAFIWDSRHRASYLGPSSFHLGHLLLVVVVNFVTLFALSILLIRTIWCLGSNTTGIETWETERHEALLRRARKQGGILYAPGGKQIRIKRQEFPYDIGIWKNIAQGMGSNNPLSWLWPFAATPNVESGLHFETNDFNGELNPFKLLSKRMLIPRTEPGLSWPPPDPERMPSHLLAAQIDQSSTAFSSGNFKDEEIEAFRRRQQEDLKRWEEASQNIIRRSSLYEDDGYHSNSSEASEEAYVPSRRASHIAPVDSWRNAEGETLGDFGVDEDAEYPNDNVPLAQLIADRKHVKSE